MERSEIANHFEELFAVPRNCSVAGLEQYLLDLVSRTSDPNTAILEMDNRLALVQNHIQLMSLRLKQKYLLNQPNSLSSVENTLYTKQELANKYRVSIRTVTNWIIDGLEVEEVGGIKRISDDALERFRKSKKGKKFNWKSIAPIVRPNGSEMLE